MNSKVSNKSYEEFLIQRLLVLMLSVFLCLMAWAYQLPQYDMVSSIGGSLPEIDFSNSYKLGTRGRGLYGYEVRKITKTDNEAFYLIEINASSEEKCYLVITQKDIISFLMNLNILKKQMENPPTSVEAGTFYNKSFSYYNGFLAVLDKENEITEIYRLLYANYEYKYFPSNEESYIYAHYYIDGKKQSPQSTLFYDANSEYPYVFDTFESKESIEVLSEILRASLLGKNSHANPDTFERIGKYKGFGNEQLELLRYKKNNISRVYLQLQSTYYENELHDVYVWMTDSVFSHFTAKMKSIARTYAKKSSQFKSPLDDPEPLFLHIDDIELGGWIIGEFDANMNIVDGGKYESPLIRVLVSDSKEGHLKLMLSFTEANSSTLSWLEFDSPEIFDDFVKILDSI